MSTSLSIFLAVHVLIGVLGVFLFGGVSLGLLKKKVSVKMLKVFSIGGLISYLTAWALGGHYYIVHYGSKVKPIIKAGDMPWAHSIVMEAKEHVFLFLPFLATVSVVSIFALGGSMDEMPKFKRAVMLVSLMAFIIGILMALAGIIISGAATI
ncbi:MAG: hypothetical protein NUV64_03795 [Parcubacteria group bacterium]|nr:hypothetical protein [Parcubacteria group bacterium]MCR4343106.1 hypothetical protein [Patescibacteria group bacterium]